MTPRQAEELLRALKERACSLDDLHERARGAGSAWSREQLLLFLQCAPGLAHDAVADTWRVTRRDAVEVLQDAIVDAVRSFAGRPVPAAQVRARLPNQLVTTDEQILALSRRTPGLEIVGPNLIRIAR